MVFVTKIIFIVDIHSFGTIGPDKNKKNYIYEMLIKYVLYIILASLPGLRTGNIPVSKSHKFMQ